MSHQSETLPSLPSSSAVPSVQVWVKEWSKRGWLSSRKWCGSSWRAPCRRSWRNCWTPAQAPRKRYTNTLTLSPSPCCSETIWLWFGVCLRHSITEWKQHRPYTFGGSSPPRVPPSGVRHENAVSKAFTQSFEWIIISSLSYYVSLETSSPAEKL